MRLKKKDDDLKIIILGIVLAAAVVALGFVSYHGVNHYLTEVEKAMSTAEDARLSDEMREEILVDDASQDGVYSDEPVVTAVPPSAATGPTIMPGIEITPQITGIPESSETASYFYLTTRASADLSSYKKAVISGSSASSVYVKENYGEDNSSEMLYDGKEQTSWKEGAAGRGEGETLNLRFDRQYNISRISFKLGNWYNYSYWVTTCRPKGLTMWINGVKYEFIFPDSMTEYCVALAKEVPASEVTIRLDSVYIAQNTNTCISEIEFYGN